MIGMETVTAIIVTIKLHPHTVDVDIIAADTLEVDEVGIAELIFIAITTTSFMITLRRHFVAIPVAEAVAIETAGEGITGGARTRTIEGMRDRADTVVTDEAAASFMIITATITFNIRSLATTDPMDRMLRMDPMDRIRKMLDRMDQMDPTDRLQYQLPMQRMLSMLPLYGINHHWVKRAS